MPANPKAMARTSRIQVARSRMPSGTFGAAGFVANPIDKCPRGPIESSEGLSQVIPPMGRTLYEAYTFVLTQANLRDRAEGNG